MKLGRLKMLALVLLAWADVARATVDSLLLAENDVSASSDNLQFTACSTFAFASPATATTIEQSSLDRFTVASQFFGASAAQLSEFEVSCTGVSLKQGRKVEIYSGAAPAGCSKIWYSSRQGIKLAVEVHNVDAEWSLNFLQAGSLPSRPLESTCFSIPGDEACMFYKQPQCDFLAMPSYSDSRFQITRARSLRSAPNSFQCPCGTPTGQSVNGQQLVIGLTELIYNQAYNSCIPDATADYRLPDLTHRRPDSTICAADPFNVTAYGAAPDPTPNLELDSQVANPHCFAVNYTGYVVVQNHSNIQFFGPADDSLFNRFKGNERQSLHSGVGESTSSSMEWQTLAESKHLRLEWPADVVVDTAVVVHAIRQLAELLAEEGRE
ncbi:hypothetical protein WJX74_009304 [Apatococcus lobatus]|uniref:Uncharacterized protein n=1 Tax=Apatococcus lobatus TaxID=904363 RepID=A0AAW1RLH0_9CHLO